MSIIIFFMSSKLLQTKENQNEIFEGLSHLLLGLASPVRIKLLHFLSQSPLSVEVLADKIGQSVANTSMHLRKMYGAGLVSVSVIGQRRLYKLEAPVLIFWEKAQDLLQALHPELNLKTDETYGDLDWDQKSEFIRHLKEDSALILDVRPEDEAKESPLIDLPFYKQIPASELSQASLPKSKTLFIFCRGRFCALSADSVFQLRKKGFKAFRLPYSWFELQNILKGAKLW